MTTLQSTYLVIWWRHNRVTTHLTICILQRYFLLCDRM